MPATANATMIMTATANVTKCTRKPGIDRERHTEVEYIVAHGIASKIDGKRAISPTVSSAARNISTVALSVSNVRRYLG